MMMLKDNLMNQKYGDPSTAPASRASNQMVMPELLKTLNEEQKKMYDFTRLIWSSAQTLNLMITSQMSHTKLNMNQLVPKYSPLQNTIAAMVMSFLKPFYHSLSQASLKIEVTEANLIPNWVQTDWDVYMETLFHLVQNAIKFSRPSGLIRIIVSFHTLEKELSKRNQQSMTFNLNNNKQHVQYEQEPEVDDDQGSFRNCFNEASLIGGMSERRLNGEPSRKWGYLLTQVEDAGEGIAKKQLKSLFSTFQKAKISVFKSQGIGIGLSTSKVLAQSLGGGISLQSEPGKGTTVTYSVQVRDESGPMDLSELQRTSNQLRESLDELDYSIRDQDSECDEKQAIEQPKSNSKYKKSCSVFHGNILKKEVEALHHVALEKLEDMKPLKQQLFVDEVMEIATKPAPKREKGKKGKGNKKTAKKPQEPQQKLLINKEEDQVEEEKQDNEQSKQEEENQMTNQKQSDDQIEEEQQKPRENPENDTIREGMENEQSIDDEHKYKKNEQRQSAMSLVEESVGGSEGQSDSGCNDPEQEDGQPKKKSEQSLNDRNLPYKRTINRNFERISYSYGAGQEKPLALTPMERNPNAEVVNKETISRIHDQSNDIEKRKEEMRRQFSEAAYDQRDSDVDDADDERLDTVPEESQLQQEEQTQSRRDKGKKVDDCCSKASILLVDDLVYNMTPIEKIFNEEYGLQCDKASDGQCALLSYLKNMEKTCCDARYRIILTDIVMPRMNGI